MSGQPLRPFKIERFFAKHEFTLKHHLSQSDCETMKLKDILELADEECKTLWDDLDCGYTESLGHPLLRKEVEKRYKDVVAHNRKSINVENGKARDSEAGVMTCVPVEGITMTMNAFLRTGDSVICMEPCYQVLQEIARSKGCEVLLWQPRFNDETNLFAYDVEDLETLFLRETAPRMLVLNTPHNPMGFHFYGSDSVDRIIRLTSKSSTIIFSDEMYGRIIPEFGDGLFHSFAGLPNSIVLSGLSKPHGLPGLRVGWLVVDNLDHFPELEVVKDYMTICASAPSEILALIALRNEEKLLAANRALALSNLRAWCTFCEKFPGWFKRPQVKEGAIYNTLFAVLGDTAVKRFTTAEDFSQALIDRFGICLVPGACFYEHAAGVQGVRIGFGKSSFEETLGVLGDALSELDAQSDPKRRRCEPEQ